MRYFFAISQDHRLRNVILVAALISGLLASSSGCAIFGQKTDNNDAKISEFEEEAEKDEKNDDSDATVFDSERKKQSNMSDFVASFGKKSKNKKEIDPGQTFLMSDKAKEIYANTER